MKGIVVGIALWIVAGVCVVAASYLNDPGPHVVHALVALACWAGLTAIAVVVAGAESDL